jgi:hypothetical protein
VRIFAARLDGGRRMAAAGMYDNYVSLGFNCEAAFQFRRLLGRDVAYFFNWLVTPLGSLVEVMRSDFAEVYRQDNLEVTNNPMMVLDRGSGMKFHSAFRKELGRDLSGPRFDALFVESRAKYAMLAQRFRDLAASPNRVLYVVKTAEADATPRVVELRDLIAARYPAHDFAVVALQTGDRHEADWGEPRIFNRYLDRFAPTSRAGDGHEPSWDRVFAEFPLRPGAMERPV